MIAELPRIKELKHRDGGRGRKNRDLVLEIQHQKISSRKSRKSSLNTVSQN